MKRDQHAHRREADGVRGSAMPRGNSLCQGAMSRGEGTGMASDRTFPTRRPATAAAQGCASHAPTRDATQASGGRFLKRAALYARVSPDTQEREEPSRARWPSCIRLRQPTAMRSSLAMCSLMTASVGAGSIGPLSIVCAIWRRKWHLRSFW
jgi:hypothetical protein